MPAADFDQFVSKLQKNKEDLKEFWSRQKDEYIGLVDEVYANVEGFLEPWTSTGGINIEYHPIEINEEGTGVYEIRKCIILIGSRAVALTPVGTQLIGTKGRIDISGAFGRSRLVLVDRNSNGPRVIVNVIEPATLTKKAEPEPEQEIDWVWKIVSNPPHIQFVEFNRENFLKTIMEVSNG